MKKVIKNKTNEKTYLIMFFGIIVGVIISIASSYVIAETLIKSVDVSYVDNSNLKATNVQAAIDGTCTKFSNDLQSFLLKVYPVGSIYISYNNTNPGTLFGGTWENYGNGRVLKGINSGTAGTTGGSATTTLKEENLPSHRHSIPVLTGSTGEAGLHRHGLTGFTIFWGNGANVQFGIGSGLVAALTSSVSGNYLGTVSTLNGAYNATLDSGNHTHTVTTTASNTGYTGSGTAFSTLDPYITVYMWRRTK